MLPEEERFAIAKWRIEKARTNVEAAKVLLDSKMLQKALTALITLFFML